MLVKRLPDRLTAVSNFTGRTERLTTKEGPLRNWLTIAALLAVSLTASPARAWWDGGNMQIAAVAYDRLDPAVPARVDALIKLNPDYSKWIGGVADAGRDRFAFVRASTWADDIRGEDGYTDSGDTPTRHNVRFAQDSDGDRWSSSRWLGDRNDDRQTA
jgi:hypothetical protein